MAVDANSCSDLQKLILTYSDMTVEEEENGLRALATSKHVPEFIRTAKYQPTLDALKKLPSIMRLNCLETLTRSNYNSYNVFGKINDKEEFKALLFSSTIKYRDRAEAIWNKYQDLVGVGNPGSVKVTGTCKLCGDFEIIVNSLVVKTEEGLKSAKLGYQVYSDYCPFCGNPMVHRSSITEGEWKR
jgi:hypothetical protein